MQFRKLLLLRELMRLMGRPIEYFMRIEDASTAQHPAPAVELPIRAERFATRGNPDGCVTR
jgi:hypothetical protein